MFATVVIAALFAVSAMAQYSESESSVSEKKHPAKGPQYYDEVYTASQDGDVYAVTAEHGKTNWREQKLDVDNVLYKPQGVAICNGAVDDWGRWAYAYVADAGDEEHPGAVYQYNIERSAADPGKIELKDPVAVYGGEEMADAEPTDVQCDAANKGVFIADAKKGQVAWAPKGAKKNDDVDPWVKEECAEKVANVKQVAKKGDWLYWSVQGEDGDENNGVYRQDASKDEVDCAKEDDVEKYIEEPEDAPAYGVAVHNDKVLFTTGKGKVWEAGKWNEEARSSPKEWAEGYEQAGYIASAHDRGLLIADKDGLYVNSGGKNGKKIADVDNCGGVDYYQGEEWKPAEEEDEDDAASTIVLSSALLAGVVARLF